MQKTHKDLFLELANPNKDGISKWVNKTEFVGEYSKLMFQNGWSWGRGSSPLAGEYILETDRSVTPGNGIDRIRTAGFNKNFQFNQNIRQDIKDHHRQNNCVILGIKGKSENTKIEIDHKAGIKDCERVSSLKDQRLDDFQPLSKAANDAKRQICKKCKETNIRFDATELAGNPISYYKGDKVLSESGCEGCYQFDPVAYRKCILNLARQGKI